VATIAMVCGRFPQVVWDAKHDLPGASVMVGAGLRGVSRRWEAARQQGCAAWVRNAWHEQCGVGEEQGVARLVVDEQ
jgi:hypothetical protein